jgi:hypothetical protein
MKATPVAKGGQGRHDRRAGESSDDDSVAETDSGPPFIRFRFDGLDVLEEHGVVVQTNVRPVAGVLLHGFDEVLAEDLWSDAMGDLAGDVRAGV